jgi:hypothetical protein
MCMIFLLCSLFCGFNVESNCTVLLLRPRELSECGTWLLYSELVCWFVVRPRQEVLTRLFCFCGTGRKKQDG